MLSLLPLVLLQSRVYDCFSPKANFFPYSGNARPELARSRRLLTLHAILLFLTRVEVELKIQSFFFLSSGFLVTKNVGLERGQNLL